MSTLEVTDFDQALDYLKTLIDSAAFISLQGEEPGDELVKKIRQMRKYIKELDRITASQLRTSRESLADKMQGRLYEAIPPYQKRKGLDVLRNFSRGAEKLIICDPYFYAEKRKALAIMSQML